MSTPGSYSPPTQNQSPVLSASLLNIMSEPSSSAPTSTAIVPTANFGESAASGLAPSSNVTVPAVIQQYLPQDFGVPTVRVARHVLGTFTSATDPVVAEIALNNAFNLSIIANGFTTALLVPGISPLMPSALIELNAVTTSANAGSVNVVYALLPASASAPTTVENLLACEGSGEITLGVTRVDEGGEDAPAVAVASIASSVKDHLVLPHGVTAQLKPVLLDNVHPKFYYSVSCAGSPSVRLSLRTRIQVSGVGYLALF